MKTLSRVASSGTVAAAPLSPGWWRSKEVYVLMLSGRVERSAKAPSEPLVVLSDKTREDKETVAVPRSTQTLISLLEVSEAPAASWGYVNSGKLPER